MSDGVEVVCEIEGGEQYVEMIRDGVVATLRHQAVPLPVTVAVLVTDDAAVHALNKQFRNEDKPTDVLSFEDGERPFPSAPVHLGDIAIALPYATRQAERAGHGVAAELTLLAVHGTLHLLGHDHADAAEKAVMWKAQGEIVDGLAQRHEGTKYETEA